MAVVTASEVKSHIKLATTVADIYIALLIAGVEEWLAAVLGVSFSEGTKTERVDGGTDLLRLTRLPLVSVTSVTDKVDGSVVPADEYRITKYGVMKLTEDQEAWDKGFDRYEVAYTGGYGGTGTGSYAIPAGIKLLILEMIALYWENRDGRTSESAMNASVNWESLAESRLAQMISTYSMKAFA